MRWKNIFWYCLLLLYFRCKASEDRRCYTFDCNTKAEVTMQSSVIRIALFSFLPIFLVSHFEEVAADGNGRGELLTLIVLHVDI